jgi:hypothetical protein
MELFGFNRTPITGKEGRLANCFSEIDGVFMVTKDNSFAAFGPESYLYFHERAHEIPELGGYT